MKILELSSPLVPRPVHYRYAWARSPMGNLQAHHNTDIPLATQRSDDWPMEETPLSVLGNDPPAKLERPQRNQLLNALRAEDMRRRLTEAEAFIKEHKPPTAE